MDDGLPKLLAGFAVIAEDGLRLFLLISRGEKDAIANDGG
jgi:hypothetical protein